MFYKIIMGHFSFLLIILTGAVYADGNGVNSQFTAEELHDGLRVKVRVVGRFVLSKDSMGQKFDLSRVGVNIEEYHFNAGPAYPRFYFQWSEKKQEQWDKSSFGRHIKKQYFAFRTARNDVIMSDNFKVDSVGRFEFEVAWTGTYQWSYITYVTDPKNNRLVTYRAESDGKFVVNKTDQRIDLGGINLLVERNQGLGNLMDEFVVPGLDGGVLRLSDYRGKFLLIDYWATWCGPCIGETPYIRKVYDRYKDKGFEVMMISMDNKKENAQKYVKKHGLERCVQVFIGDRGKALKGESDFKRRLPGSIPHIILIGPDGKLVASGIRGEGIEKAIIKHMAAYEKAGKWKAKKRTF